MENGKVCWGILGAGKVAYRFAQSLLNETDSKLVAIALRSEEKALKFREKFEYERYYLDYEQLINDEKIDAIYLSLPHGLHKKWAIKAMQHGKAVLCEKPAVLNAQQMQEIIDASRQYNVLFMEAMKSRFTVAYRKMIELIQNGEIGKITAIKAILCYDAIGDRKNLKMTGETYHSQKGQGGCLLDSGIYCANYLEEFMSDPIVIDKVYADVVDDIDVYVDSYLKDESISAELEVAFSKNKGRYATLTGTNGEIMIYNLHRPERFDILKDGNVIQYEFPLEKDDFYGEIHHFTQLVKQGKKESTIMTLSSSYRCAHILDIIKESFTKYEQSDLEILLEHENSLQYPEFHSQQALELGNKIVELLKKYDSGLAIQIIRKADNAVIFQYITDDKTEKNIAYAGYKRNTVDRCGHSSMFPAIQSKITGSLPEELSFRSGCFPVGGSFPIRVNNQIVGNVAVSGLHEGKDYEIIVRALSEILNKETRQFRKAMI